MPANIRWGCEIASTPVTVAAPLFPWVGDILASEEAELSARVEAASRPQEFFFLPAAIRMVLAKEAAGELRGTRRLPDGGRRNMSWWRSWKRKPSEEVVFAGERMEAELVVNLLREEGFHPLLWADMPAPAYLGPVGTARVVVPPEEAEGCRRFLASLEEAGEGEEGGGGTG